MATAGDAFANHLAPADSQCCQTIKASKLKEKFDSCNGQCITQADSFDVLHFNEDVLRISFLRNNEMRKKLKKSVVEIFDNRARRFTAYGQFPFWIYGKQMIKG